MIEELEKLKNEFAIELNYRDFEILDKITQQMFNLIQNYINNEVNKDDRIKLMQKAKNKAEQAHKDVNLQEFIIQIDVISLLLTHSYCDQEEQIDFTNTIDGKDKKERIEHWVRERKEILLQDPRFFIRLQNKITDLLRKL